MEKFENKICLIISGGKINTKNNFVLTCDPDIKPNAEAKFSTDFISAQNDKRCHFVFEKTNSGFKIKSAYKNLFLGSSFDFITITKPEPKILLVPPEASEQGYILNFDIQQNKLCNYKIYSYFQGTSSTPAGKYRMSSYKGTGKGKNFVLSAGYDEKLIGQQDNFLFKIIPLENSTCFFQNNLNDNNVFVILPGTNPVQDKALTCIDGIKENTEIKPKVPYVYAKNDPRCLFSLNKTDKENFYEISPVNEKSLFWSVDGPRINKGIFPFNSTSSKVVLKNKNNYSDHNSFIIKIEPTECFYNLYGIDFNQTPGYEISMSQLSTYKNTNEDSPLVMSWGHKDENSENYYFRLIKAKANNFCKDPFEPIDSTVIKGCDKNKYRLNTKNDNLFLTDKLTLEPSYNIEKFETCFEKENNSIIYNGKKLGVFMDYNRNLFLKFEDQKKNIIGYDNDKLEKFEFIKKENSEWFFIKTLPTKCITNSFYFKNDNGKLVLETNLDENDSDNYLFRFLNTEVKKEKREFFKIKKKDSNLKLIQIFFIVLIIIFIVLFLKKN